MKNIRTAFSASLAFFSLAFGARGANVILVESERFDDRGGWQVDSQFMDQMGSPYLLAHGLGQPVPDARTKVPVCEPGEFRVYVRTMNWTGRWSKAAAGTFKVAVNGKDLPVTLGTGSPEWTWVDAGTVRMPAGFNAVALRDLTGFDGRCDAIAFAREAQTADELDALRRSAAECVGRKTLDFDFVVTGGGVAGICAAVTAARAGLRTALVQDRPVLGGNNSSEVRVHLGAYANLPPYPRLGDVLNEIAPAKGGNARPAANYEDERKMKVVRAERNLSLFLGTRVNAVEKDGDAIAAVVGTDVISGEKTVFRAPLFADATGDGTVGFLAGADFRMGREARSLHGEPWAPEKEDRMTMGASVQWYARQAGDARTFPPQPWMLAFDEKSAKPLMRGDWNWETGLLRDQIAEFERIRDYGLLVAFSNWSYLKNAYSKKADFAAAELEWVAYVAGKRESRRLLGDFILTERHLMEKDFQKDGTCATTWTIDQHFPFGEDVTGFKGESFLSDSQNHKIWPYPIPYRCFYSRNVPNLFMAGRDISVSHVALGTTRLMRTHGMMGEVVGMAAAVCKARACRPRDVYARHFADLVARMEKGAGDGVRQPPQEYNCQRSLDPDILKKHRAARAAADDGWKLLPVYGGGFMQAVEICAAAPKRWYAHADVSGPFRSDDGGRSWRALHMNMPVAWKNRKYSEVRGLSVDPRDPDSFVMCGGDAWNYSLGAILVSRDGGRSFREVRRGHFYGNGPRRLLGRCLDRDPFDPDTLVAGEDRDGLVLSRDNGETWSEIGLKGPWFADVRFDRKVRGRIWATAPEWFKSDEDRRPGGFWRSDDYGKTWTRIRCQPPTELCQTPSSELVIALFGDARRVYATRDGGAKWIPYHQGMPEPEAFPARDWDRGNFDALAAGKDFFLAIDKRGTVWRRRLDDEKWTELPAGKRHMGVPAAEEWEERNLKTPLCVSNAYVDPTRPDHWLMTDWYDIWESEDEGRNWTTRVNGIQQLVPFEIACDPFSASNLTYVVADLGVLTSRDGGRSYHPQLPVRPMTMAAYSHRTPGLLYAAGARWQACLCRSDDAGVTWKDLPMTGLPADMYAGKVAPYMVSVHPVTDDVYLTVGGPVGEGAGGIYRSSDRGETWSWSGRGLPAGEKLFKNVEFGWNAGRDVLFSSDGSAAIAMARAAGKVFHLDAASGEWRASAGLKPGTRHTAFADAFTPGRFVVAADPVMESVDGGRTFHPLAGGEGRGFFEIAADPHTPGLVLFSGYDSVWVSYDGGRTRTRLEGWFETMPTTLSRRVIVDRGRVFYLTNGSGVWTRELKK